MGDKDEGIDMFRPNRIEVTRYRFRGNKIPTPWDLTRAMGNNNQQFSDLNL